MNISFRMLIFVQHTYVCWRLQTIAINFEKVLKKYHKNFEKYLEKVLKKYRKFLEMFWKSFDNILKKAWKVFEKFLENIFKNYEKYFSILCKYFEKVLIIEHFWKRFENILKKLKKNFEENCEAVSCRAMVVAKTSRVYSCITTISHTHLYIHTQETTQRYFLITHELLSFRSANCIVNKLKFQ